MRKQHRKSSRSSGTRYQGRIQKNPRGFAFIISHEKNQPDAYVSRRQAFDLFTDDIVEYSLQEKRGKIAATVHSIIKRGKKILLGHITQDSDGKYFQSAEGDFLIETSKSIPEPQWALAEITRYPTEAREGSVQLLELLGKELSPSHDIQIAVARHGLPIDFSNGTKSELNTVIENGKNELSNSKRKDLSDIPLVTIDGEDAKDFDDAVAVVAPQKGPAFILYVAIADVSFFVTPHSALDRDAFERSTSVYFPNQCIPMLPEELSNDLCSLRPKQKRLALTAEIAFDRHGNVESFKSYESIIQTKARLTYTQVQAIFDNDPKTKAEFGALLEPLRLMKALYKRLESKRKERGVLEFELPECKIELDKNGFPLKSQTAPRYDSHKLIEEFMIAANQQVAKALRESNQPALYRVHESPDPKNLAEINLILKAFGIGQRLKNFSSTALADTIEVVKKHKSKMALQRAILRQQKQAHYSNLPDGHFGLALKDYTHFTSPIRRYPDLVVHRALKTLIAKGKSTDKKLIDSSTLGSVANQCSENERRAMEAERFVIKRKQCWLMKSHVGDHFQGQVNWINPYGITIELPEFLIEGFLPLEDLNGYYEWDPQRICYLKRPGHSRIQVGDTLEVQLVKVSVEENDILFAEASS